VALRAIRDAAGGRLRAVHFGVFDYTAAIGLPAEGQRLDHPACDAARHLLQMTFAGTEVRLSDGSTNARPASGATADVHAVWARHAVDVRHSLAHGFVQGWDLHPSHLVSRYATVFAHLLTGIDQVLDRLAAWQEGTTAAGGVMDEPATIAVLQRVVDRAVASGAISAADARARGAAPSDWVD
jgi:citrate lyase beta subunit